MVRNSLAERLRQRMQRMREKMTRARPASALVRLPMVSQPRDILARPVPAVAGPVLPAPALPAVPAVHIPIPAVHVPVISSAAPAAPILRPVIPTPASEQAVSRALPPGPQPVQLEPGAVRVDQHLLGRQSDEPQHSISNDEIVVQAPPLSPPGEPRTWPSRPKRYLGERLGELPVSPDQWHLEPGEVPWELPPAEGDAPAEPDAEAEDDGQEPWLKEEEASPEGDADAEAEPWIFQEHQALPTLEAGALPDPAPNGVDPESLPYSLEAAPLSARLPEQTAWATATLTGEVVPAAVVSAIPREQVLGAGPSVVSIPPDGQGGRRDERRDLESREAASSDQTSSTDVEPLAAVPKAETVAPQTARAPLHLETDSAISSQSRPASSPVTPPASQTPQARAERLAEPVWTPRTYPTTAQPPLEAAGDRGSLSRAGAAPGRGEPRSKTEQLDAGETSLPRSEGNRDHGVMRDASQALPLNRGASPFQPTAQTGELRQRTQAPGVAALALESAETAALERTPKRESGPSSPADSAVKIGTEPQEDPAATPSLAEHVRATEPPPPAAPFSVTEPSPHPDSPSAPDAPLAQEPILSGHEAQIAAFSSGEESSLHVEMPHNIGDSLAQEPIPSGHETQPPASFSGEESLGQPDAPRPPDASLALESYAPEASHSPSESSLVNPGLPETAAAFGTTPAEPQRVGQAFPALETADPGSPAVPVTPERPEVSAETSMPSEAAVPAVTPEAASVTADRPAARPSRRSRILEYAPGGEPPAAPALPATPASSVSRPPDRSAQPASPEKASTAFLESPPSPVDASNMMLGSQTVSSWYALLVAAELKERAKRGEGASPVPAEGRAQAVPAPVPRPQPGLPPAPLATAGSRAVRQPTPSFAPAQDRGPEFDFSIQTSQPVGNSQGRAARHAGPEHPTPAQAMPERTEGPPPASPHLEAEQPLLGGRPLSEWQAMLVAEARRERDRERGQGFDAPLERAPESGLEGPRLPTAGQTGSVYSTSVLGHSRPPSPPEDAPSGGRLPTAGLSRGMPAPIPGAARHPLTSRQPQTVGRFVPARALSPASPPTEAAETEATRAPRGTALREPVGMPVSMSTVPTARFADPAPGMPPAGSPSWAPSTVPTLHSSRVSSPGQSPEAARTETAQENRTVTPARPSSVPGLAPAVWDEPEAGSEAPAEVGQAPSVVQAPLESPFLSGPAPLPTEEGPLAAELEPVSLPARRVLSPLTGVDAGSVRVFRGPVAHRVTSAARSDGLTVGEDIFLAPHLSADTPEKLGVLAHELTHVRQHRLGSASGLDASATGPVSLSGFAGNSAAENEREALQAEARARHLADQTPARAGVTLPGARPVVAAALPSPAAPVTFPGATEAPAENAEGESLEARKRAWQRKWGALPAPWEPFPQDIQGDNRAGTTPTRFSSPAQSSPSQSSSSQTRQTESIPVLPPPGNPPPVQAAETSRSVEAPVNPLEESPEPLEPAPSAPNLDLLAQEVYERLKRRLKAEARRFGL